MINLVELKELCDDYDSKKGDYPESRYEGESIYEFAVERAAKSSEAQLPQADNSDYAKCADDILKLELADEIINKHGCLVAILKRHFA